MKWWKVALAMAGLAAAGMVIAGRSNITQLRRSRRS
jgi:hypothetical protein